MTTTEVLRVLDADEACRRILAAGYSKQSCAICGGRGHDESRVRSLLTGETQTVRVLCSACDGAGFTWEPPAKLSP